MVIAMTGRNYDTDVFVIGGGPAGLAAAMAARQRGLRVIVADGGKPPADKACGEGLMPDSLEAAHSLGISLTQLPAMPFRGIRFHGEQSRVESLFPSGHGLGIRRTVLHTALTSQAESAGIELLWSTPVTGIEDGTVHFGGQSIRSRWILGADGANSLVRKWIGCNAPIRNTRRYAYRRHYGVAPWTDHMEIYWGRGCQIYITPVNPAEVCVALISRTPNLRLDEALERFPVLQTRLRGAQPTSTERGAVTSTMQLRRITRGNTALIGDASGSVDAVTGEGICLAFQQARALGASLAQESLQPYVRAHRKLAIRPSFMADFMLLMDRSNWIRDRALHAMSTHPEIFGNLLAMHVGPMHIGRFAGTAGSLVWNMLAV